MATFAGKRNEVNITKMVQGKTWRVPLRITDEAAGAPVDLAGWTGRAQIRQSADSADILATWTCSILEHAAGDGSWVLWLVMPFATTATIDASGNSLYVYDAEIVHPTTGEPFEVAYGTVEVIREVTR